MRKEIDICKKCEKKLNCKKYEKLLNEELKKIKEIYAYSEHITEHLSIDKELGLIVSDADYPF